MSKNLFLSGCLAALACCAACSKNEDSVEDKGAKLIFKYKFDPNQERLGNLGQPVSVPAGNAAQSPAFRVMSSHYLELAPGALTALGKGAVLYKHQETAKGGETAIDFASAKLAGDGEVFYEVPLKDVPAGKYEYLRVSLAYQNYDIKFNALGQEWTGSVASFIGFNSYITSYKIKDSTQQVNGNRKQGYWALETKYSVVSGQAPAGATTVPNPIAATSPVPAGSCVVTGPFDTPLQITGKEKQDVVVTVSLSVNKSFEWKDTNGNGKYDPLEGEAVVDMGVRGLKPLVN
ncbi:hypothetical protein ACFOTA_02760 [Chitinophaga sp. GCM10012297]|uniref:Uncharacterized protein n=1 Tax=Chitinophaga chungangae TaxID=2821488 RepID=A0ABS3Y8Y7_9BACT|nr:hypothetical protein [Chitinophaga chungangae]MBO9151111.1 hypothetical protein [Chitinophaga chungangae]